MSYTSEQYKYLLLRKLQKHFSMTELYDRNYTLSFFGKLFDESVTVTEDSYNAFIQLMDIELEYCASHKIYSCESIPANEIESQKLLLQDSFNNIGISTEIELIENKDGITGGKMTFVKPNGEVMVYTCDGMNTSNSNFFNINAIAGTEYQYAIMSSDNYLMLNDEVISIDEYDFRRAGIDCYWDYDAETATMTITGNGSYYKISTEEQIGSGEYSTIIFGANVSHLTKESLWVQSIKTVVLLHSADFPLILDNEIVPEKAAYEWDVYADNEAFRNYPWSDNIKITWHSLNEWEG